MPCKPPYVYFIQDYHSKLIKIGYSEDVIARFKSLQQQNAAFLVLLLHVEGDRQLEQDLHTEFAEYRSQGEWFKPGERLVDMIAEIKGSWSVERAWRYAYCCDIGLRVWQYYQGIAVPDDFQYVDGLEQPDECPLVPSTLLCMSGLEGGGVVG